MTEKSPPAPIGTPRASIADQSGTLDILTATYLVVRDSEESEVCDTEFFMYDGTRRSKIEIGDSKLSMTGSTVTANTSASTDFPKVTWKSRPSFRSSWNIQLWMDGKGGLRSCA